MRFRSLTTNVLEQHRRIVWSGGPASIFVMVVLVALLIVPLGVQRRVDRLREEIEQVSEPSRALLAEVQYLLARQSSELLSYRMSGDPLDLDHYEVFTARELQIYPQLERHAASLSPEVLAYVVELRTLSEQWHARLGEVGRLRTDPDGVRLLEHDLYLQSLEAAGRADVALRFASAARRQEIRDVERLARLIYFLLLALALGATVSVATLNARIQRLAAEANNRRLEIESALEDTARAVAARTDLIRGFTHDVKNPLGAADGYAHLLEAGIRGELSPDQKATVQSIRRSIRGAIEIIEQLLDLSRLETGGLQIRRERVDLEELVRGLVRHYTGAAISAGIDLNFATATEPGFSTVVFSDPDRIRQILDNLITNALKYTPAGGRVLVSLAPQTGEAGPRPGRWVAILVSDTGPGIPIEEIDRIFDEFHRVPGTVGRGHGLGLAISRRVGRLLGGDVTVRSTFGTGSTFQLWLPQREDAEPDQSGS